MLHHASSVANGPRAGSDAPRANPIARRGLLAGTLSTAALLLSSKEARAVDAQTAGAYLPPSSIPGLVDYVPARDKTPALRAGTIKPEERYSFAVPPNVKEQRISNTQNSNFCQPRCAEPWTEVVFEDPKLGRIQLMAVPLLKLTNAKNAKVADLGSPEQLLTRLGPYITGTYYDEDWLVDASTVKKDDGLEYYHYELNSLDALQGPRSLTAVTAKGEVVYLFILLANDKQWKASESVFRTVRESFKA